MPVNITDVDTWSDPVSAPADGDAASGASVDSPAQSLANRTRYLRNRLDGQGLDASVAQLITTKLPSDHPANVDNEWKLIFQHETGYASNVRQRYYAGSAGDSLGVAAMTINARWNPTTELWQSDDSSKKSLLHTHGVAGTVIMHKAATASTWEDWDTSPVSSVDGRLGISGDFAYVIARDIQNIRVNLSCGVPEDAKWVLDSSSQLAWLSAGNSYRLTFPLSLPIGATLKAVRGVVAPGDTTGTMNLKVVRVHSGDTSTPTAPTYASLGTATSDGTTALQSLAVTGLANVVTKSESYAAVIQASSNGGSVQDVLRLLEFDMSVVGPAMFL